MVSVVGGIFIALFVILVVGAVGWVAFTQLRARKLGLPPPSLASYNPFRKSSSSFGQSSGGGVVGWIKNKVPGLKKRNDRTAAGAYEEPLHGTGAAGGRGRHGFGPLDPDDAWDARVGQEAHPYGPYEEQELGNTSYHGGGGTYNMNLAATPGVPPAGFGDEHRGRQMSRSPGLSPRPQGRNPFDDDAEPSNVSLRGVSPRPIDTSGGHARKESKSPDSPTGRRSIFREEV